MVILTSVWQSLLCLSLSYLRTPPFPTLAYVNRLHGGKTHSCHTVSIRQKVSYCPTPGRSTQLTVKLRVNGGKWLPRCLVTHVINEKRDKREFAVKSCRVHFQLLKQLWVCWITRAQTHTKRNFLIFNLLYFPQFTSAHILCYSFPSILSQLHMCTPPLCDSLYVYSQYTAELRSRFFCSL